MASQVLIRVFRARNSSWNSIIPDPVFPRRDDDGEDIQRLQIIWNKCTLDITGKKLYYEVQYWENDRNQNYVHARLADEIESNYPEEVDAQEEKFRDTWDAKYSIVRHIWNPDGSATKRTFNDTPGKARKGPKKSRVSIREVDSKEDEEMEDADPFQTPPTTQMNQISRIGLYN